jgi:hypothetical protein
MKNLVQIVGLPSHHETISWDAPESSEPTNGLPAIGASAVVQFAKLGKL